MSFNCTRKRDTGSDSIMAPGIAGVLFGNRSSLRLPRNSSQPTDLKGWMTLTRASMYFTGDNQPFITYTYICVYMVPCRRVDSPPPNGMVP